ncbi:MAG: putative oxidoreductase EphD [Stenotrophomonas maltophilia]|nr:MAG: putative oxidoreductase EphD [Stenotrophomonas maltophilia]
MNAQVPGLPEAERLTVQSGEVRLAVYRWGERHRPVLLLVHGYPDNHAVWLPLVAHLLEDYQLVAYDVRGAGASDAPRHRRDYHLAHLSADLQAVIAATSPQRPVHLLAHDWGSIQTWESVSDPQLRNRIASYTSISGPCLDHVGWWMRERLRRRSPGALREALGQLLHSWYIYYFHLPLLPELTWRLGGGRFWPWFLRRVEGIRQPPHNPTQARDGRHGVKLYRANFIRALTQPRQRPTSVPVQLIVPSRDHYVGAQLFHNLEQWAPQLWRRDARAGHWQLLDQPQRLAQWLREFIEYIEGGEASAELEQARVAGSASR